MISSQSFDVAVIGGGIVGLSTACGLAQAGLSVALVETQALPQELTTIDHRVSAINHVSQQLLTNLGAWQKLDPARIAPYQHMQVWCQNRLGKLSFDAQQIQHRHLGHIIENQCLTQALTQIARQLPQLTVFESTQVTQLGFSERESWLSLTAAAAEPSRSALSASSSLIAPMMQMISAAVVIAADGANSWVRQQAQIPLSFSDYGHHALVCTIDSEWPHQQIARQIFQPTAILANLPLYQPSLSSIVWSAPPEEIDRLMQLTDHEFEKALSAAYDGRLGRCRLAGDQQRQRFPLMMRYAQDFVQHRLILAGDAAHTIHPLAGLGVNLGLIDAGAIIETLSELHQQGKDIGELRHLKPLGAWRQADAMEMIAVMESLKQLFTEHHPLLSLVRDVGMLALDHFSPLKTMLIKQATGKQTHLPKICKRTA